MMSKVAVIFESSPFDRKGLFNAVHNRTANLIASGEFDVDAYCMLISDDILSRRLRKMPKVSHEEHVTVEGVTYKMLWRKFSYMDELRRRLSLRPNNLLSYAKVLAERFKEYDVIVAHSYEAGLVAYEANLNYGVPYTVTWHGSDVHTHPMNDESRRALTAKIMEHASVNFFVSEALSSAASKITDEARKGILYNGVSENFYRFDDAQRLKLREQYGLAPDDKVVAYVGNFLPVKNVAVLPDLFARIQDDFEMCLRDCPECDNELKFWVVGDGKMRADVEPSVLKSVGSEVKFWGNLPVEVMPQIMNCIDVLLLPSRNEGLPLVTLEALRCGASVLGAEVGGIPEVIGNEFCVPFSHNDDGTLDYEGDDFCEKLAQKTVKQLFYPVYQRLDPRFSWSKTTETEIIYLKGLGL